MLHLLLHARSFNNYIMDFLISLVVMQVFVSLCSAVKHFKECNEDRQEVSIPLPDPKGNILEYYKLMKRYEKYMKSTQLPFHHVDFALI